MKERIFDMARQIGATDEQGNRAENVFCFTKYELKNFAELIVKECVSTLNDMHMWQSVNNQNYPNSWHDAVDQGIDAIKTHFGVEE